MMLPNDYLQPIDEAKLKIFLSKGLVGGPNPSTERLLVNTRLYKPFPVKMVVGFVAAMLLCLTFFSSLQIPALAQALASMPLIGDAYTQFITSRRLDIAYQLGMLQELGRSTSANGFTLTVHGALADQAETVLTGAMSSEDKDLLQELWRSRHLLKWSLTTENKLGETVALRNWDAHLDGASHQLYFVARFDHLPESLLKKEWQLSMILNEWKPAVSLDVMFPVQAVANKMLSKVTINQTLSTGVADIAIKELTFSPTQTVLGFKLTSVQQAVNNLVPIDIIPRWRLDTMMGDRFENTGFASDEAYFPALRDKNVKLTLLGLSMASRAPAQMHFKEGEVLSTAAGDLLLADIVNNDTIKEARFSWDSDMYISVFASLENPTTGHRIHGRIKNTSEKGISILWFYTGGANLDSYSLVIEQLELLQVLDLEIMLKK